MPSTSNGGRIVIEIPTHNELRALYDTDLGLTLTAGSAIIGCGFPAATVGPDVGTNSECTMMEAPG